MIRVLGPAGIIGDSPDAPWGFCMANPMNDGWCCGKIIYVS
jgi:hypothetical protein